MQFHFTEEQQAFADSVRRFALAHLEMDTLKRAHDPRRDLAPIGLIAATPEDYAATIDRELTMWSDLVRAVVINPE